MLLVGSLAAKYWHPALWPTPNDVDVVATWEEFQRFVDRYKPSACPLSGNKFVTNAPSNGLAEWELPEFLGLVEWEIAWPGSSGADLLNLAEASPRTHRTPGYSIASMDLLFTIKASHRFKKNDPHWRKTLRDYHVMKYSLGCVIEDCEWLDFRERETYKAKRPKLNTGKQDFFSDDGIQYKYDHDTIHEAMAHLGMPAYRFYQADDAEVMCSEAKWWSVSESVRLYGVLEEAYVLALERSQIPYRGEWTPRQSFEYAFEKICSSITSGWFRAYAYENWYKVLDLYRDNYVERFDAAVSAGVVKEA